jgi:eukaryotic-like serine/threonine-protein kinase
VRLTPERWAQVEELFHRAVECDAEQRALLLDEVCCNDPGLRREVENLLSCDASARDHLQAAVRAELNTVGFPLTGQTISHYLILDGLGGGGMGLVYRAEDIKLGRRVALKFLPEGSAKDPVVLGRFEREARSASALEHPNICPVYEFGEHEGQPFLVMQLLEGQTLRELISAASPEAPIELGRMLDLAVPILDGLNAAHQKGIIHRDIKPANIFVTSQGQPKILDFGLAKLAGNATSAEEGSGPPDGGDGSLKTHLETAAEANPDPFFTLSRTGVAMGTAGYMSPEQVRGETVDARTDLFSFGLVLYEMATGRRAFTGETGPVLQEAILKQTPIPAREVNPTLPAKIEEIIAKALEKNREARYQSAAELRSDLENLQEEVASPVAPTPTRFWRPLLYLAGLLGILLVAGTAWIAGRRPVSALPELKLTQLTQNSSEIPVRTGTISPDGKLLAYTDHDGVHVKILATNEIRTLPQPDSLRDSVVHWNVCCWFPDGNRFVLYRGIFGEGPPTEPSSIWVASALGGAPRMIRDGDTAEAISPDGSLVAFTTELGEFGGKEVWAMGPDGEHPRKLFDAVRGRLMRYIRWSPDGQRLAYVHGGDAPGLNWTLESRDIKGGPPVIILPHANAVGRDYVWLPNGDIIYGMDEPGGNGCNFWKLKVDIRTGEPVNQPQKITHWAGFCMDTISATADGKRLAFTEFVDQQVIYVAPLQEGGTRISTAKRLTLIDSSNWPAGWTNDSKSVIFVSHSWRGNGIYRQALDSDTAQPILTDLGDTWDQTVSPDGKWILYVSNPTPLDPSARKIMRVSIDGGPAQPIASGRFASVLCARLPSTVCLLAEDASDPKKFTLSALDPLNGRGREFLQVDHVLVVLSPDGTRVAVSDGTSTIKIVSLGDGNIRKVTLKGWDRLDHLEWASDSKGIYVSSAPQGGAVLLYSDLKGNAHVIWEHQGSLTTSGIPSPDGRHIAMEGWNLSSNVWTMENF